MPRRPRTASSSPTAKRVVLASLLSVVVFVTMIWTPTGKNDIFNSAYTIQEKKNGVVDDFVMEAAAPRLLLVRAIHNLPYTRLSDIQACVEQVLDEEVDYWNVQRHWILNRLQPPSRTLGITKLLDSYGETYDVLEFDTHFYAHLPYNFGKAENVSMPSHFEDSSTQAWLRHDKILYSVNMFGMRNLQLDYGQARAQASAPSNSFDWILPWDFDMILTDDVHRNLIYTLSHRRHTTAESALDYLLIPVRPTNRTAADHALIASTRATWRFDAAWRYGQDRWLRDLLGTTLDEIISSALDMQSSHTGSSLVPLRDPVQVLSSSSVTRWTPPFNATDVIVRDADQLLVDYIDYFDIQTAKEVWNYYPKEQWTMHTDRRALAFERRLWKAADRGQPEQWRDPARAALIQVVSDLVDLSESNWKSRFGKWRVADNNGKYSPVTDAKNWHDLTRNVTIWALASHLTGQSDYGHYAVKQLKAWFWGDEWSMKPHLSNALSGDDWYAWLDLTFLLDAAKLLAKNDIFTKRQEGLFIQWCTDFKDWLVQQETTGIVYDAILAAVAYFVKDDGLAYRTLALSPRHFPAFRQFLETHSSNICSDTVHQQLYAFHVLARQSQIMGIHLWKVKPWWGDQGEWRLPDDPMYGIDLPDTSILCNLTEDVARQCAFTVKSHWSPIWDGLRRFCRRSNLHWMDELLPAKRFDLPSVFDAQFGIAPFWNLGYRRLT